MKSKNRFLASGIILLVVFILFTVAVLKVDVQPVGPEGSCVGFASVNKPVADALGFNETLYKLTELLGYVVLAFVGGFGILGFLQLLKRKSLLKVDADIIVLGCFYIVIGALYLVFDKIVINYRPVLIDGVLSPSYPSSHTFMTVFVMSTAIMQFNSRIKNKNLLAFCQIASAALLAAVVLGRFMAGEHWLSDIVASVLLGTASVALYRGVLELVEEKKHEKG